MEQRYVAARLESKHVNMLDAVYDSATNSYDPGNEVIIATYGSDMIDGGGGLNTADFSLFPFTPKPPRGSATKGRLK